MTHQNLKWTKKNKVFSHSEVTKRVLVGSRLLDLAFPFFSFFLLWKLKKRTWFVPILFSFRRGSCVNIVFISHEFQTFLGFHVKATNAAISSVSFRYLFYLFYNGWKDQNMDSSFSCQRKPWCGEGIVWLANRVTLWRQSEVSIDFSKVLGHEVFSTERSLNQPKATRVCTRSINQSNRSISVRLLFLFCSRLRYFKVVRKFSLIAAYTLLHFILGLTFSLGFKLIIIQMPYPKTKENKI